jgi:O-antigen/teichoic acid export membrane protein
MISEYIDRARQPAAMTALRRRLVELIPATVIFGLGGLAMSSTQAIALRIMSREEVGRFVLAYGVASVGATVIGLGLPQLISRTASIDRSQLAWRRAVWIVATVLALPGAFIATGVALAFPSLRQWGVVAFLIFVPLMITANLQAVESSYRRVNGQFMSGAAVLQATLAIVTLALLVPLVLKTSISALSALWIMLAAQVALFAASSASVRATAQASIRELVAWLRGRISLLMGFWLASTVAIGFRWADRLVLAGVLPLHQLSEYQSLFIITSLYDLLAVAIGYINLPRYARIGSWSRSNLWLLMFLAIGTTTVTIAAGAALGSRIFLIHWTVTTVATFLVLMAVGMFKLGYAEVSAAVGAIAKGPEVLKFSGLGAATLVVGIGVTIVLGIAWGMLGAAVGALGLWALRVLISYAYMIKWIDNRPPTT